ncbi:DUF2080 family transposase-associated protein [Candidatus Woesearchaeota archaeon]|uniref:DUF2080 family transposase-associated protein n=1 Tax=Methanobacterium sp. TaxID=2164 RepID=UPI0025DCEFC9|nr:DUF2080 family transposase-associated protein [Methanobacterium sp.]MBI4981494.1 DUF2080 family transposase-associated protein [Candidatus Woesearchaeota archaeon]MBI5458808.1 DUF2080 family transposase-associated protein [Methanobacterium sp.]
MKKIKTTISNEIKVKNIRAYFEKTVTQFGNGAKIDAPKEYIGEKVIILVKKKRVKKTQQK